MFVMGSTVLCAHSLSKGDADITKLLSRFVQLRNSSSVHMLATPRSAASIFVLLKLFLAAFAKLELMVGRGQMQERLYNSCDGLSCYCFLTGRDFPCIRQ